jgi:hypothetical protein
MARIRQVEVTSTATSFLYDASVEAGKPIMIRNLGPNTVYIGQWSDYTPPVDPAESWPIFPGEVLTVPEVDTAHAIGASTGTGTARLAILGGRTDG